MNPTHKVNSSVRGSRGNHGKDCSLDSEFPFGVQENFGNRGASLTTSWMQLMLYKNGKWQILHLVYLLPLQTYIRYVFMNVESRRGKRNRRKGREERMWEGVWEGHRQTQVYCVQLYQLSLNWEALSHGSVMIHTGLFPPTWRNSSLSLKKKSSHKMEGGVGRF